MVMEQEIEVVVGGCCGKVNRNRSTKNSVFTGLLEQVESYTTSVLSAQSVLPSPQLQPSIFLLS